MSPLLAEGRRVLVLDPLDPDAVVALCRRLRSEVASLAPDERRELARIVLQLTERVAEARTGLQARLAQTTTGRRALNGYAHLRSTRLAQRIASRA